MFSLVVLGGVSWAVERTGDSRKRVEHALDDPAHDLGGDEIDETGPCEPMRANE